MKKYLLIYGVLLTLLFAACGEEDDIKFSGKGAWTLSVPDKSGRFNELAYQIFKDTGMPIFVNDTLGSEQRGVDYDGNPIIHYEIFLIGYTIASQNTTADFVLSEDTLAMVKAAELIRDKVLPRFLPNQKPLCFLLADSLYSNYRGWNSTAGKYPYGTADYACKDMMGMVVGKLSDILEMSEEEQAYWCGSILAANIRSEILSRYPEELKEFYDVSLRTATATWHENIMYAELDGTPVTVGYDVDYRERGFFEWIWDGWYAPLIPTRLVRKYPTKEIDVADFIAAVYAYDETEFEELYKDYPLCIEKYKLMKQIVADYEAQVK